MNIFVLPVSGGGLVVQLMLLMQIHKIFDQPDFMISSSGGAVSSFVYLAADANPDAMIRICRLLNSRLLTVSWWSSYLNFLPSSIVGFFKGTIYKKGSGTTDVMKNIFSTYNISRIEVFIGTTERNSGRQQIFSNKSEHNSIMNNVVFDYKMNNSLPIKYAEANIDKIARIVTASSTIPVLVPDEKIDNEYYVDGGTTSASGLGPMSDSLDVICKNKNMHITYFNSYDIESSLDDNKYYNLVQNTDQTLSMVLRSLAIQDRLAGINLVRKCTYRDKLNLLYFEGKCDTDVLALLKKARLCSVRSFLELYTKLNIELDLTDFKFEQIIENINIAKKDYSFRIWLACNDKYVGEIKHILSDFVKENIRSDENIRNN